jgi:OOP family OmpA-OmpF porin
MRSTNYLIVLCLFWAGLLPGQGIEKLNNEINTHTYDEISPILSVDGHTLYFTRVGAPDFNRTLVLNGEDVSTTRPDEYDRYLKQIYTQITGRKVSRPDQSDFNQDVWVAESTDEFFDRVWHPKAPLNNALPNSICSRTTIPNQFIVVNQFPQKGGLRRGFSVIHQLPGDKWSFPEPLRIRNFSSSGEGVNLNMSYNGEVLFLSLKRKDTRGESDLYISFQNQDGTWTAPRNLGPYVNSGYKDATPYLSDDMRTLFFASNRPGASGMDIYYTQRKGNGWDEWTIPLRLSPPVNSPADDSQPHLNAATGYLYFSSSRDGSSDLFRVRLEEPTAQDEIWVQGRILNSVTGEQLSAKVFTQLLQKSDVEPTFYFSADGTYRVKVPKTSLTQLKPERKGFIGNPAFLDLDPHQYYFKPIQQDLYLDPIALNAKISLPPVFFEQSKSTILSSSYRQLEHLYQVMNDHPEMHILIEGHTDNVGPRQGLIDLSKDRADAIKTYLRNKGIAMERIQTRGYGPDQPLNNNLNEEERRKNRRVEFRMVKI